MKASTFRLDRAMVVLAVIAINLAVLRPLFHPLEVDRLLTRLVLCFALEFGMLGAIRRRSRARAFWLGFVCIGSLATLDYSLRGSLPSFADMGYWKGFDRFHEFLWFQLSSWFESKIGFRGVQALFFCAHEGMFTIAPLLLAALMGGLIALLLHRIKARRTVPTH